ncbi:hypothetical protein [Methylomonas rhizoryzae]|uniref:hypothetical protein n=1 Tax=Methylomonas rhizoryzae TaxID=2608981 RepID=UPI0016814DC4|nr:hypothetical protein [Methylomonas rhizoryzae]
MDRNTTNHALNNLTARFQSLTERKSKHSHDYATLIAPKRPVMPPVNAHMQRFDNPLHSIPFRLSLSGQDFIQAFPIQAGVFRQR